MTSDDLVRDREAKMTRALIEAHVGEEVAPIVLEAFDDWVEIVNQAREALRIVEAERGAESVSPKDAARILGCSTSKVYRMIRDGELPDNRVGRAIKIPTDALRTYRAEHETWHEQPVRKPRAYRSADAQQVVAKHPWLDEI